ncbi:MAG: hypothetical protein KDI44_07500 [Thiothrix sp.]|nr:hypothetical protein [Thiothrix sp.]
MVDVTIKNPGFTEYYECENERRTQSWASAGLLAVAGALQIALYHDVYAEVVKSRNDINRKIYQCALKEHEHWRDHIYPHTLEAFAYAENLPEIVPEYADPLTGTNTRHILTGATAYATRLDDACDDCTDGCNTALQAEYALALTGAATQLMRNEEQRAAARRELKLQGMGLAGSNASKNLGAAGRQSMGVALNITNTLVAMSASGMNSGLATFGRGLTGLATALDGA